MNIDFTQLKSLTLPEGVVVSIAVDGKVAWSGDTANRYLNYVSLGDSISAGHTIDENWKKKPYSETGHIIDGQQVFYYEGTSSQYGETLEGKTEPNKSTIFVKNCYADRIRNKLIELYGAENVTATSFSHSGDTVGDLIKKLSHTTVRETLAKADLVTISIGANDILGCVSDDRIGEFVNSGSLASIESEVEANLTTLNTDDNAYSYMSLLNKLKEINPNAKYVFTTVYNPYKYLWADDGRNGFFAPLLNTIPNMDMDLGITTLDIDGFIKDSLLGTPIVAQMFSRVNMLGGWVETYITRLNNILKSKVSSFNNNNFIIADTKTLFDGFPDRLTSAEKHYNDLVNVEFTRGLDYMQIDWGALWRADYGDDVSAYWWDMANEYIDVGSLSLDINGFADDLMNQVLWQVLIPDIDPHPEVYGQYCLSRSFLDAIGLVDLDRWIITFNPNGASGSAITQVIPGVDNLPMFTTLRALSYSANTGYTFGGWNTNAGGGGSSYSNAQYISIRSNLNLYAQWNVQYFTLTYKHSRGDVINGGSDQTGPMDCYALAINDVMQDKLGAFSNSAKTYSLPYGTKIAVAVAVDSGSDRSYVSWNGSKVDGSSSFAYYEFTLTSNVTINFEWNQWLSGLSLQSYWNCYITT